MFAAEEDLEVIPGEAAANAGGVADEGACRVEIHLHKRGVIGGITFLLEFVVIDAGIFSLHDFSDGVGEVERAIKAGVGFDDGTFAGFVGDDKDARMAHGRFDGSGHA